MRIESPVKKWPGHVVLPDYLNLAQALAWEEVVKSLRGANPEELTQTEFSALFLPGVFSIVQEWKLEGLPENMTAATFPFTPGRSARQLINWLIREIGALWQDEEIPND